MSNVIANRFSAAGAAIGYLAQVEYALLIALQRMDREESLRLSLETVDDITFATEGGSYELWQTKHHVHRQGSLSDTSPDLWKSLHNWIESVDERSTCFLFTTVTAADATASSMLRPSRTARDVVAAREKLDGVARARSNKSLFPYYDRYLGLPDEERTELLSRITVLDGQPLGDDITGQLVSAVRKTVVAHRRKPLIERLRGWWHDRAMAHLTRIARGGIDWITMQEIEDQLHLIAQSLRDDNLPLDYGREREPTKDEVDEDDRVFVEQLKLIMLHHTRIRQAVYDHNRAFLQRSRWQREQLLAVGELDAYDQRLIEEWQRVFLPLEEPSSDNQPSEETKRRNSRGLYLRLQERALPEIRSEVRSGYIPLGTLHLLADRLQIGWHPDWVDLLKHRLDDVQTVAEAEGVA
ncbi:ABC-three component system protein [Saccharopolyspora hattusasensis]|uniref:ABC-three component system protein n=1 Tax=Saccharopolyspora hattusasensis TaxID=1128679 RepID=UPI003D98E290